MKRKLEKLEKSRRKLIGAEEVGSGEVDEVEAGFQSSEEDEISDELEQMKEIGGKDEELEQEKKRKKGALSVRDQEIMLARRAEQSRIDNLVPYRNKQRVLVFCSRGINSRFRHLMEDMRALLPHHRKEIKHDTKRNLREINELCELKGCNGCMFFEARKRKDLYLWLSKTPSGPSIKFLVQNIHTMDELRLTGNCLKGSRPFLSFGKEFELDPTLQLIKEMFLQIYGTPRGHPKSKPFVDHVMNFSVLDGKIWFRHYQITDTTTDRAEIKQSMKIGEETVKLAELGPRFVLDLIKVFDGSFGGRTLVSNESYVTPNSARSVHQRKKAGKYVDRKHQEQARSERAKRNVLPSDPLRDVFKHQKQ